MANHQKDLPVRPGSVIARNLLARRFAVLVSDTGWVTDITYLWTLEGWLYLAVILGSVLAPGRRLGTEPTPGAKACAGRDYPLIPPTAGNCVDPRRDFFR